MPSANECQYEEMLRLADDIDGAHRQARARATIIYFSSRMEAVRYLLPFLPLSIFT
jgi:hypothetical protein